MAGRHDPWRHVASRICFLVREAEEPWELAEALDGVLTGLASRYGASAAQWALEAAASYCPEAVRRRASVLAEAASYAARRGLWSSALLAVFLRRHGLTGRPVAKERRRRRPPRAEAGARRPRSQRPCSAWGPGA